MTVDKTTLSGIGGWLAIYIIILCINILLMVIGAIRGFAAGDSNDTIGAFLYLIVAGIGVAAVYLLLKEDAKGLTLAKAYMVALCALGFLMWVGANAIQNPALASQAMMSFILQIAWAFIWWS